MLAAAQRGLRLPRQDFARRSGPARARVARGPHRRGRACSTIARVLHARRWRCSRRPASRAICSSPSDEAARRAGALRRRGRRPLSDRRRRRRRACGARAHRPRRRDAVGVGLMAEVFVRLYHLTDAANWREAAERLIGVFRGRRSARTHAIAAAAERLGFSDPRRMRRRRGRRAATTALRALTRGRASRARSGVWLFGRSTVRCGPRAFPAAGRRRRRLPRRCSAAGRYAACRSASRRRSRRRSGRCAREHKPP